MSYYNKQKSVFEEVLSSHLDRCLQLLSAGDTHAINAVRALEGVLIGYTNTKYNDTAKELQTTYDFNIKAPTESLNAKSITEIEYQERTRGFAFDYSLGLFKALNLLMVERGIHPLKESDLYGAEELGEDE